MAKVIILALFLGLSGCAFVFQDVSNAGYKNLVYGMSKEQVIDQLGNPQTQIKEIIVGQMYEIWEYPVKKPDNLKLNSMGSFSRKVFFSDGKLVRWDKDKIYAQPSFEFQETRIPE